MVESVVEHSIFKSLKRFSHPPTHPPIQHPAFPERIAVLQKEVEKVRPIYEETKGGGLYAPLAG